MALLDDVLYPTTAYRVGACRVGARLIRRYCGVDISEALEDYFIPGEEALAVRAALEEGKGRIDERWIAKAAAAMAAHVPRISPYSDAVEVFPLLQGMGVRLGLIGEGPPLAQRQIVRALRCGSLFHYQVWIRELRGSDPWRSALQLMELMLDSPIERTAIVCADPQQAASLAEYTPHCFCVFRPDGLPRTVKTVQGENAFIPMVNLYELPEALGWVLPSIKAH